MGSGACVGDVPPVEIACRPAAVRCVVDRSGIVFLCEERFCYARATAPNVARTWLVRHVMRRFSQTVCRKR